MLVKLKCGWGELCVGLPICKSLSWVVIFVCKQVVILHGREGVMCIVVYRTCDDVGDDLGWQSKMNSCVGYTHGAICSRV